MDMSLHHAFDRGLTNAPCTLSYCTRLHVHVFTDVELRRIIDEAFRWGAGPATKDYDAILVAATEDTEGR